eukprot:gene9307-1574_t
MKKCCASSSNSVRDAYRKRTGEEGGIARKQLINSRQATPIFSTKHKIIWQPATSNQQPATSNQQPATSNQQPATSNHHLNYHLDNDHRSLRPPAPAPPPVGSNTPLHCQVPTYQRVRQLSVGRCRAHVCTHCCVDLCG